MSINGGMPEPQANPTDSVDLTSSRVKSFDYMISTGERIITTCGFLLVIASVASIGVITFIKFHDAQSPPNVRYSTWLDLIQHEDSTISLFLIAIVAALLGKRLLTSAQLANTRTIPRDDLPLVRQAVIDGKAEPIDQYVRLRSLSGMSGTFTKLGITGLPLTTVLLTLIFSFVSLLPVERAATFLDLAKLTLGAFIGSFVQRQVEQRRQERAAPLFDGSAGSSRYPDLPA